MPRLDCVGRIASLLVSTILKAPFEHLRPVYTRSFNFAFRHLPSPPGVNGCFP